MRRALSLLALFTVALLLIVAGLIAYTEGVARAPLEPGATELVEFEVPKGASLAQVGRRLVDQGFLPNYWLFRLYTRMHPPKPVLAGLHPIRGNMTLPELLGALAATPLPDDLPLTMVEGLRFRDLDLFLASGQWISPGAYLAAATQPERFSIKFPFKGKDLEGYLFPETYAVPKTKPLDVDALIQRQLDAFVARFYEPYRAEIEASGRTLSELVIMASILEREEPTPALRPKVAGVLYKRLDAETPLGVDATSRYFLEDWSDRKKFLAKLRDPEDPYNTRLRPGLPPGPIGAPSLPSLIAALRPIESPYWYYLHDRNKQIHFSKTAEEHEKTRKKYNVY